MAADKLLPDELEKYQSGNIAVRSKIKEGSKKYLAFHSDEFVQGFAKRILSFNSLCSGAFIFEGTK